VIIDLFIGRLLRNLRLLFKLLEWDLRTGTGVFYEGQASLARFEQLQLLLHLLGQFLGSQGLGHAVHLRLLVLLDPAHLFVVTH